MRRAGRLKYRESSSFSAEKEPKKTLLLWAMGVGNFNAHGPE
jgi:hypothetical protein